MTRCLPTSESLDRGRSRRAERPVSLSPRTTPKCSSLPSDRNTHTVPPLTLGFPPSTRRSTPVSMDGNPYKFVTLVFMTTSRDLSVCLLVLLSGRNRTLLRHFPGLSQWWSEGPSPVLPHKFFLSFLILFFYFSLSFSYSPQFVVPS